MSEMTPEEALAHFGVKGMHWGVRKGGVEGVSSKTNREAKKDAEEYTRAKLYYGEGAGTRRKLIKATVEGKAKRDPTYKKAFDHHVGSTDLAKRASQARGERKRKDTKNTVAKTGRGVSHILRGNPQYASATAAMLVGGALYARKAGIDRIVMNAGKEALKNAKTAQSTRAARSFLKANGINVT
jgi:SRSO17 transposase